MTDETRLGNASAGQTMPPVRVRGRHDRDALLIVDAHSGSITVESTPGAGSQFTIRLPLSTSSSTAS